MIGMLRPLLLVGKVQTVCRQRVIVKVDCYYRARLLQPIQQSGPARRRIFPTRKPRHPEAHDEIRQTDMPPHLSARRRRAVRWRRRWGRSQASLALAQVLLRNTAHEQTPIRLAARRCPCRLWNVAGTFDVGGRRTPPGENSPTVLRCCSIQVVRDRFVADCYGLSRREISPGKPHDVLPHGAAGTGRTNSGCPAENPPGRHLQR